MSALTTSPLFVGITVFMPEVLHLWDKSVCDTCLLFVGMTALLASIAIICSNNSTSGKSSSLVGKTLLVSQAGHL